MPRHGWRPSLLGERLGAGAAIVVVPAVVLWARQNSRAQLRVHSFGGAVAEVIFWSAPTALIAMFLLRRRPTIISGGVAATAVLTAVWWGSARDWHSTASWRPALMGWFLLPIALLVLRFVEGRLHRGHVGEPVRSRG